MREPAVTFHPFISVPRNDYLDEDMPDDATITLSIIPWQSKTRASEPELCPASELHARLEHGQDDVPGWWSGLEQVIAAADDAMLPGRR
jgi:hypothetical protein